MDEAFGHWFAGFFDGEGSVGIYPHSGGHAPCDGFRCVAKISLRIDDRAILEEIAATLGIGRVYLDKKGRGSTNPAAAWIVEGRDSCLALVEVFDRFPLRAKKAEDVRIWSEAVRWWVSVPKANRARRGGWAKMVALREELRAARVAGLAA